MVLLVEKYVCAKAHRTGSDHYDKQIERKNQKHPTCDDDSRIEKIRRVVSLVATIVGGHQMVLRVVRVIESDVVSIKDAADPVMTEAEMK
jgi:hypothetical protein